MVSMMNCVQLFLIACLVRSSVSNPPPPQSHVMGDDDVPQANTSEQVSADAALLDSVRATVNHTYSRYPNDLLSRPPPSNRFDHGAAPSNEHSPQLSVVFDNLMDPPSPHVPIAENVGQHNINAPAPNSSSLLPCVTFMYNPNERIQAILEDEHHRCGGYSTSVYRGRSLPLITENWLNGQRQGIQRIVCIDSSANDLLANERAILYIPRDFSSDMSTTYGRR